jgi:hypothetical protein
MQVTVQAKKHPAQVGRPAPDRRLAGDHHIPSGRGTRVASESTVAGEEHGGEGIHAGGQGWRGPPAGCLHCRRPRGIRKRWTMVVGIWGEREEHACVVGLC